MVNVALLWSYVELMDLIDAGPMWLAFQEWILRRGVRSAPPPQKKKNGLQFSNITSELHKICCIIFYVFSGVHVMLLTSHKPSSLLFTFENFYHRRSPVKNHGSALTYFFTVWTPAVLGTQSCVFVCLFQGHIGGRVTLFQTTLPNIGPGQLKKREDGQKSSPKVIQKHMRRFRYYQIT